MVVLPEPVAPVTSTRPRRSSASRVTPSGRPSLRKFGISLGITRNANDVAPRWRNPLTRKRGRVGFEYAISRSPVSSNVSRRLGEIIVTASSTVSRSISESDGTSCICSRSPSSRHDRRLAELEMDVAGAAFDGGAEEGDEVDHVHRTSADGRLSFTPLSGSFDRQAVGCRQTRRATRATRRNGGRARPRASFGCPTSPRRSPLTTPKTPGERAAQKHTVGWRSSARLADHDAPA